MKPTARELGLVSLATTLLGAALYGPWAPAPFSAIDYSEFLPILQGASGPLDGVGELWSYYRGHGRSNLIQYVHASLAWTLFGDHPVGWDWSFFAVAALMPPLGYALFRRLGAERLGAAFGASILVVGSAAQPAWIRMVGESHVVVFGILAALLALGYRAAPRYRGRAVAIATLALAMALAKDLAAVLALPILVLGAGADPRSWLRDRRSRWLTLGLGAVVLFVGGLVLTGRAALTESGYASAYGASLAGLDVQRGFDLFLPLSRGVDSRLGQVLFLGVLLLGWPGRRRVMGAVALAALGLVAYAPWPLWLPFYALPFSLGVLATLAVAIGSTGTRWRRVVVLGSAALLVLAAGSRSFTMAQWARAERRLLHQITLDIATLGSAESGADSPALDTLYIPLAEPSMFEWSDPGATLVRNARRLGFDSLPSAASVRCGEGFSGPTLRLSWLCPITEEDGPATHTEPFRGAELLPPRLLSYRLEARLSGR